MNRFRPQETSKLSVMKQRLKYKRVDNYSWQTRVQWYRDRDGINRRFITRVFQYLHHHACHAPEPVQKHWRNAYRQFDERYFASRGNASIRFLNNWTSHAWM